jgi:hypothetical protein
MPSCPGALAFAGQPIPKNKHELLTWAYALAADSWLPFRAPPRGNHIIRLTRSLRSAPARRQSIKAPNWLGLVV